jgi:hypothetical protein
MSNIDVAGGAGGSAPNRGGNGAAGRAQLDAGSIPVTGRMLQENIASGGTTSCTYPCGLSGAVDLLGGTAYTWKVRATDAFHALVSQPFGGLRFAVAAP